MIFRNIFREPKLRVFKPDTARIGHQQAFQCQKTILARVKHDEIILAEFKKIIVKRIDVLIVGLETIFVDNDRFVFRDAERIGIEESIGNFEAVVFIGSCGCDGIAVDPDIMVSILSQSGGTDALAESLVRAALGNGGRDNITVICVDF